jgi:branched-chain amino acid transport system ATP-binding protein
VSGPIALALDAIQGFYGKSHILQGVSLEVRAGEIVCLLGRNGAGKTSTLKAVSGLLPPRGGAVRFHGTDVAGWPAHRIARAGLTLVP